MSDPFLVFYVCTGNQARSPIAAAWTARALAPLGVRVGSAGTSRGRPAPVLAEAGMVAAEMGLDLSGHSSSHVSEHDLSKADLVIGFELQHVSASVVDAGAAVERAFLLKELCRLAAEVPPPGGDPVARARETIRRADELRRTRGAFVPGEDVKDPAGRRMPEARRILAEVVRGCDDMVNRVFGR